MLAIFRDRYSPKAGSPIIDAADPADDDSQGRRADIGAIDVGGHDQDKLGKFGMPPSELVPPTVSLTAPTSGAQLTGKVTLAATAMDNPGGTGVVLVQFLVDGAAVGQTATAPYSSDFDTAKLMNGDHAFTAKAWDGAGNSAVSAVVMAHAMNTMTVAPDAGSSKGADGGVVVGRGGSGGSVSSGGVTAAGGATSGVVASGGVASGGRGAIDAGTGNSGDSNSGACTCGIAERRRDVPAGWGALGLLVARRRIGRRRRHL